MSEGKLMTIRELGTDEPMGHRLEIKLPKSVHISVCCLNGPKEYDTLSLQIPNKREVALEILFRLQKAASTLKDGIPL